MKKTAYLLLVVLLVLQVFTACGTTNPPTPVTTATPVTNAPVTPDTTVAPDTTAAPETTEAPETEPPAPEIPAIDGKGEEFRILGRQHTNADATYLPYPEFAATAITGEIMNDTVYKRNEALAKKYNVKIIADVDTRENVRNRLRTYAQTNDPYYDLYSIATMYSFTMASEGHLRSIDDIPYVDIDNPWWHTQTMENFSIGNVNYALIGDLNYTQFMAAGALFFNQKVATENNVPNLYNIVREGKWTVDKMHEIALTVTRDLDGDQQVGEKDMWGLVTGNFTWMNLFYGGGTGLIEKDSDDIPVLVWNSEKNLQIIEKITSLLNDGNATMMSNQHTDWTTPVDTYLKEDRALFRIGNIYTAPTLRTMETEFGILPMPKYDEAQDKYYTYVHYGHSNVMVVPKVNQRLELTGAFLEEGTYLSYKDLRPAFFEATLTGKIARNEDTVEMLEILFAGLNPDLALPFHGAGMTIDTVMRKIYDQDMDSWTSLIESEFGANEANMKTNTQKIIDGNK